MNHPVGGSKYLFLSVRPIRDQRLEQLHALLACGWLIGMLASPPVEAVAYAGLLPVALLRWRYAVGVGRDRLLIVGTTCFGALIAWAAASQLWSPASCSTGFPARLATVPLLVLHAGVRATDVRLACFIGGGYRVAIGALGLVGAQLPAWLVPNHSAQETPGLLVFGAATASLFAEPRWWIRLLPVACLSLWAMAAAQIQSVGTVVASSIAGVVAVVTAARSKWLALATVAAMMAGLAGLALALRGSPLWIKTDRKMAALSTPQGADALVATPQAIDAALSARLQIWDWTIRKIPEAPLAGHGAGSWAHAFKAAVESGAPMTPWESPRRRVGLQSHAHNLYLQVLFEFGVVGLALLVVCLGAWSARAWGVADPTGRAIGVALLVALLLSRLNGQGDMLSRVSILMFVCTASLAGASAHRRPANADALDGSPNPP